MFQQLLTIARNTFTESIRQPVFAVLVLCGSLALVLNLFLAAYTLENDTKLMTDLSLSMIGATCVLLAAFTATGVLTQEVENRTVLTVVSKPVSRAVFILGKYLGVAGALALAFYVLSLIYLFTYRHGVMTAASDLFDGPVISFGLLAGLVALMVAAGGNYLYRRVFGSSFVITLGISLSVAALLILVLDKRWVLQSPLAEFTAEGSQLGQIVVGLGLIFEGILLVTAVAIAASTRLGQIMTLVVCVGVGLLGLISNSFSQLVDHRLRLPGGQNIYQSFGALFGAEVSVPLKLVYTAAKVLYLLLPNLQFHWPADAITQGNPFSVGYVAAVSMYSLLFVALVLAAAVALFQTREVG